MNSISPWLQSSHRSQLANLFTSIGQQWRSRADLSTLFTITVQELCLALKADCVQICRLESEQQTQVIADYRREDFLLSTFRVPRPQDKMSFEMNDLFYSLAHSAIVDVQGQRIQQKPSGINTQEQTAILPAHQVETLSKMGVRLVLLVPLYDQQQHWGKIALYYSVARPFLEADLEIVQLLAELLSIAICQDPSQQVQLVTINPITQLLHLPDPVDLKMALEATVFAFKGIGGRLYLLPDPDSPSPGSVELHTCGSQPTTSAFTKYSLMEQYQVWQHHFDESDDPVWTIDQVTELPELQNLQAIFQLTPIRGVLMIPLWYQQHSLGYLTLFRAGQIPWDVRDREMAQELGMHFAAAISRSRKQSQLQTLMTTLEKQVQERTAELQQFIDRQKMLLRVIVKIRQSLDIDTIFRTTTRELCQVIHAERVAVYRFTEDWGGEFVNDFEFASQEWDGFGKFDRGFVWNDSYLQETKGGRYRFKESLVIDDIYAANLSPCHIEGLEQFQIRSHAIVPIFVNQRLWGLLAGYQHSGSRHWEAEDVQFMNHVAEQLGVALQQAHLAQTPAISGVIVAE
ncbi:MAG: GAF domain-containing protein [Leptolyngbya sp. Prado105]|jgi:GAF domain-containing protein|nr:GAF domain-containing protein [Leptolyngbya sp. Prado105]